MHGHCVRGHQGMQDGKVVEQGTHAELLARGAAYARLYELQFRDPEP